MAAPAASSPRVALVTGAGNRIGAVLARRLALEGYAVIAIFFALPVAHARSAQEFGVWTAICDQSGYCSAIAIDEDFVFSVGRHAEQPYWELKLRATGEKIPYLNQGMVVTVDGEVSVFEPTVGVRAYGDDRSFYLLGDPAQEVMSRMTPDTHAWVSFFAPDRNRPPFAGFSREGLSAALTWIDHQQDRFGSDRVAEAPPYGLLPVYPGETRAPDLPRAIMDRHRTDPECSPFEVLASGREFMVDRLMEGYALYVVPCWSAAYNFGSKVYLEVGGQFIPQYLASYGGETRGWAGTPFIVNYSYDPKTRTLSEVTKCCYRGV